MEISITYQSTIKKGEERGFIIGRELEGQRILTLLATKRFCQPKPKILKQIKQITDTEQLEALCLKVLTATSWDDLFELHQ